MTSYVTRKWAARAQGRYVLLNRGYRSNCKPPQLHCAVIEGAIGVKDQSTCPGMPLD